MPASRILRLARTSRCAIVGSDTRNARAISSVVEAAERAQRERHLGVDRERRVAAGEDQLEAFVAEASVVLGLVLHGSSALEQLRLRGERALAPDPVDRAVARGRDQPPGGARRHAFARPALGGDRERLLGGLLGEVEVAEEADQRGEDPPPLLAEDLLDQRSTTGRTSTAPPMRAAGIARGELDRRVEVVGARAGSSRRAPPSSRGTGRRSSACGRPAPAPSSPCPPGSSCAPPLTPGVREIAKYSPLTAPCSASESCSNASIASPEKI